MNVLQLNLSSSQTIPVKITGVCVDSESVNIHIESSLHSTSSSESIEFKVIKKIVKGSLPLNKSLIV
jgi:hypothetical protein